MKKKQEISTVLIYLFLVFILLLGGAIYGLREYYFIKADEAFNSDDSIQAIAIITKKNKNLKLPDFSMVKSDKFDVLQEGYWYVSNEDDFKVGNDKLFRRVVLAEEEKK